MTNEEILRKAIEKANEGSKRCLKIEGIYWCVSNYPLIVFEHDFAKAFWGEELVTLIEVTKENPHDQVIFKHSLSYLISSGQDKGGTIKMKAYRYHLQQMVIQEEEPLKYLEKFL